MQCYTGILSLVAGGTTQQDQRLLIKDKCYTVHRTRSAVYKVSLAHALQAYAEALCQREQKQRRDPLKLREHAYALS